MFETIKNEKIKPQHRVRTPFIFLLILLGLLFFTLVFCACQKAKAEETATKPATISSGEDKTDTGTSTAAHEKEIENTDSEPPQIIGAENIVVQVNSKVSYRKNVTVKDNVDENLRLEIDSSSVNLKEIGEYDLIYSAVDSAGNRAEKTVKVIVEADGSEITSSTVEELGVLPKDEDQLDADVRAEIYALADDLLAEILTPEMTPREKAEAIYWWNKYYIDYVNYSNKSNWLLAARQGLVQKKGDCYNYFATGKLLLERAAIPNIDVIKTNGTHFWSLVQIDGQWYHFDTTPRRTEGEFFLLTDAELMAYSKQNGNSHTWDHELYPATPVE